MVLLDLARWLLLIGTAAVFIAWPVAGIWWFADEDGFNRRFSSLPRFSEIVVSVYGSLAFVTLALKGGRWALILLALSGCVWVLALVNYLSRRTAA